MARPKGTLKYRWNEEQAQRVRKMAMIGCNDNHIASIEEMSESQLQKMYNKELADGRAKGIAAIAQTAYQLALSGKNPAMTMFFLKCRGRWKEVHQLEHSGPDGAPIETKRAELRLTDEQQVKIAEAVLDAKRK